MKQKAGFLTLGLLVGFLLSQLWAAKTSAPKLADPSRADIGFCQDMAVHHDQAIQIVRASGERLGPRLDRLAEAIVSAQQLEIGTMRGWLQLWDAPTITTGAPMSWLPMQHDAMAADQPPMPGMASQTELNQLTKLTGRNLKIKFLQLMIRHHQGGVSMATAGSKLARVPAVKTLASSMALQQDAEIKLMQRSLALLGGTELAAPKHH